MSGHRLACSHNAIIGVLISEAPLQRTIRLGNVPEGDITCKQLFDRCGGRRREALISSNAASGD